MKSTSIANFIRANFASQYKGNEQMMPTGKSTDAAIKVMIKQAMPIDKRSNELNLSHHIY